MARKAEKTKHPALMGAPKAVDDPLTGWRYFTVLQKRALILRPTVDSDFACSLALGQPQDWFFRQKAKYKNFKRVSEMPGISRLVAKRLADDAQGLIMQRLIDVATKEGSSLTGVLDAIKQMQRIGGLTEDPSTVVQAPMYINTANIQSPWKATRKEEEDNEETAMVVDAEAVREIL